MKCRTRCACRTLSAAIGSPSLGASLDRSSRLGRVLTGALGLYAVGLAAIALSIGHVPTWLSVAIALCVGFFMPAISGGWSSRLKSFVADEQMARASAIEAMAQGLGMNCSYVNSKSTSDELDSLFRDSDVVVLCASLNDATRGLIDSRRLGLLKPLLI